MTVREYTGARYVPEIIGEWNIDNSYEPLSIVTHQGASYTSRQAVPIGIPITNTTYWALTGNYNAQIEQYRQEVQTFNGRIGSLEGKFPITSGSIADDAITSDKIADDAVTSDKIADDAITSDKIADDAVTSDKIADNAITSNKIADDAVTSDKIADNAITSDKIADGAGTSDKIADGAVTEEKLSSAFLNSIKDKFANRNIIVIGDSFTLGTGATTNWVNYLHSMVGATCYNYAANGQGFVNNVGGTFYSQAVSAVNDTSFDNADITDVIVMGGFNDWDASESTLHSAVTTLFNYIKSNFPNARMWCGAMLKGVYPLNYGLGNATKQRAPLIHVIENAASLTGACVMNSPWLWLQGIMSVNVDNVHFNNDGHHIVAGKVITCMMGGNPCPTYFEKHDMNTVANIDEADYVIECTNGVVTLRGFISSTDSVAEGGTQVVATLPEWAWTTGDDRSICVTAQTLITAANLVTNAYKQPFCWIRNGSQIAIQQVGAPMDIFLTASWTMGI